MADLRETLTLLKELGVRTAHFGPDMTLSSVTFGDSTQEESDDDDDEDESPRMRMARAAAGVLTGKAKTLEQAFEGQ
jgi:hypothetical protein